LLENIVQKKAINKADLVFISFAMKHILFACFQAVLLNLIVNRNN